MNKKELLAWKKSLNRGAVFFMVWNVWASMVMEQPNIGGSVQ